MCEAQMAHRGRQSPSQLVMFATLFRLSIGLSGQAGLPIAVTAGCRPAAGCCCSRPCRQPKLPADTATPPLLPKRAFILPCAQFWWPSRPSSSPAASGPGLARRQERRRAPPSRWPLPWRFRAAGPAPPEDHASLADPRMAALDRRWREISAHGTCSTSPAAHSLPTSAQRSSARALAWHWHGATGTASPAWGIAGACRWSGTGAGRRRTSGAGGQGCTAPSAHGSAPRSRRRQ